MQNSGVVAKICYYISSKKQKSSRDRRLEAPSGVREGRAGGKRRQNLRKVRGKVGERYGDENRTIAIRLTRAKREPCNGGFTPRTPMNNARFAMPHPWGRGPFLDRFWTGFGSL